MLPQTAVFIVAVLISDCTEQTEVFLPYNAYIAMLFLYIVTYT